LYDVCIIGAGINGCAVAYHLTQKGKRVALIDKEGIAAGGSGAAGAFIAPKFSKGGELKALMDEAFVYALEFYETNFPASIQTDGLLHIARYEDEEEKLRHFKNNTSFQTANPPLHVTKMLTPQAFQSEKVFLQKAAIVDAKDVCNTMAQAADFYKKEVTALRYTDAGYYDFDEFCAKRVVLANGAYRALIEEPYIKLRGVWGHRIDVTTDTCMDIMLHHHLSIAACKNGITAIGATHNVHYHPQKNKEPYDLQRGRGELLSKAAQTIALQNIRVLKDYTGLRSGSNDYMPLVGSIVESAQSRETPVYYPNLFMINGVGGYGFVLAPLIAKQLSDFITDQKEIDKTLLPLRFYKRYLKDMEKSG
jgi:tRNA 5-methylaminomethyl-2-thiouridine biosynthesis bifunctional protein